MTETSGNTVKVKLSGATTITKSETVKHKLFPGDEVVIAGAKGSKGTVAATSVTDSGARSTSTQLDRVHEHRLGHQRRVGDQLALRRRLRGRRPHMTSKRKDRLKP